MPLWYSSKYTAAALPGAEEAAPEFQKEGQATLEM